MFSRSLPLTLGLLALLTLPCLDAQQAETPLTPKPVQPKAPLTPTEQANLLVGEAIVYMKANKEAESFAKLSEAIKTDPKNGGAYVLRASIYYQKKDYTKAEADFKTAAQLSPQNTSVKFQLVEIKFLQKQYDVARVGYEALTKDPEMGDLAKYKVFLCNLYGGHEAAAKKQFDAFNDLAEYPSYYYGNAAWYLYHKDLIKGRDWLLSAQRVYASRKVAYYIQTLWDLGYLPLPKDTQLDN